MCRYAAPRERLRATVNALVRRKHRMGLPDLAAREMNPNRLLVVAATILIAHAEQEHELGVLHERLLIPKPNLPGLALLGWN
jgi:hypothetical protein